MSKITFTNLPVTTKRLWRNGPNGILSSEGDLKTVNMCEIEDLVTAEQLSEDCEDFPDDLDPWTGRNLYDRLLRSGFSSIVPSTLASSAYRLQCGDTLVAALSHLMIEEPFGPASSALLKPAGGWISASSLPSISPSLAVRILRDDLSATAVSAAKGWLIGCPLIAYDPQRDLYEFRYQLVGAGSKMAALDGLRDLPKYSTPTANGDARLRKFRKPVLKLLEPTRIVERVNKNGDTYTCWVRGRLPEFAHSQWHLWVDGCKISDVLLFEGLRESDVRFDLVDRK